MSKICEFCHGTKLQNHAYGFGEPCNECCRDDEPTDEQLAARDGLGYEKSERVRGGQDV